jgi:hypothetical protein
MKRVLFFSLALGVWLTFAPNAFSIGLDVVGKGPECSAPSMTISGDFTSTGATYTAGGNCHSNTGSLGTEIPFSWTGRGAFSNNIAEEKIVVPPAPLSQASHPYGEWETIYSCPSDPWLTGVACTVTKTRSDGASNAKALESQFDSLRSQRPVTAAVTQAQRDALLAKRDADLKAIAKAEAEQRRGAEIRQATPQQMVVGEIFAPTIRAPTPGQRFYVQTPVPIRLASPQGSSVNGYLINLEMKDPKNNWTPVYTNIGVDAAQAESATGFMGFGPDSGGMVGSFPLKPGTWRVNAQVSSPRPSRWSDWVEFGVIPPPPVNPATVGGKLIK